MSGQIDTFDSLDGRIENLERALSFFDQVQASSEDERIAVGQDHYDWVFRAARDVVLAAKGRGKNEDRS